MRVEYRDMADGAVQFDLVEDQYEVRIEREDASVIASLFQIDGDKTLPILGDDARTDGHRSPGDSLGHHLGGWPTLSGRFMFVVRSRAPTTMRKTASLTIEPAPTSKLD